MLEIKLKNLLKKNNMTIAELSDKIATNRASLTQLANGESKMIKFETLDKIISAFNINDLSDLFRIVNAGKIVATLISQDGTYNFTVMFKIQFEPVRGEKLDYDLPISFSLSRLKDSSYILQGEPLKAVTNQVQNAFSWAEDSEILEFIQEFWDQLVSAPKGRSTVLDLSGVEEFAQQKNGRNIQIFFVVKDLPWLSKIIELEYYDGQFLPLIYPDGLTKSHIAPTPLIEKSKNEVIFISDLYNIFKDL